MTAWQGVSRAETQKAYEQAEAEYTKAFQVCTMHTGPLLHQQMCGPGIPCCTGSTGMRYLVINTMCML